MDGVHIDEISTSWRVELRRVDVDRDEGHELVAINGQHFALCLGPLYFGSLKYCALHQAPLPACQQRPFL